MSNVIWVDENDKVLGEVTRKEAHAKGLLHRIAVTYLVNDKGQILVNERADSRKLDHSSAGHVDVGEEYLDAALRELNEELGVTSAELKYLGTAVSRDKGHILSGEYFDSHHVAGIFVCKAKPVEINKDEVASVFWSDPKDVLDDMAKNPEKYTKGFVSTLRVFLKQNHEN